MTRFAMVSGVSFVIDAAFYAMLATGFGFSSSWAKRFSFLCIIIWAFFAHKHFTFRKREFNSTEPIKFALLYLSGWALNSVAHDYAVANQSASLHAFLLATFVWACWNFLGQKYFVFRSDPAGMRSG